MVIKEHVMERNQRRVVFKIQTGRSPEVSLPFQYCNIYYILYWRAERGREGTYRYLLEEGRSKRASPNKAPPDSYLPKLSWVDGKLEATFSHPQSPSVRWWKSHFHVCQQWKTESAGAKLSQQPRAQPVGVELLTW